MSVDILPLLPKNSKQNDNKYITKGDKNRQIKQNLAIKHSDFTTHNFSQSK